MDAIPRIQPTNPDEIVSVDSSVMRACANVVLVHSVSIKHLPANVEALSCAITITVNGSSYTTSAMRADAQDGELDSVIGTRTAIVTDEELEAHPKSGVFKVAYKNLSLLFPGTRRSSRAMATGATTTIENPREFAMGVQVTLHSEDRNHVFGSALCKCSGEAAQLSYPRGEATVSFRVYPCVDGVPIMERMYNKPSLGRHYLYGEGVTAAAAIEDNKEEAAAAAEEGAVVPEAAPAADAHDDGCVTPPDMEECAPPAVEEQPVEEAPAAAAEEEVSEDVPVDAEPEAEAEEQIEEPAEEEEAEVAPEAEEEMPVGASHSTHEQPIVMHNCTAGDINEQIAELVPCYYENQRKAAFALYDTENRGFITREQLLHFCRAHEAYADVCPSDEDMLRSLMPYIPDSTPAREGRLGSAANHETAALVVAEGEGEAEEAKPMRSPRSMYYHPTSGNAAAGELEVSFDLFSIVALKLARA